MDLKPGDFALYTGDNRDFRGRIFYIKAVAHRNTRCKEIPIPDRCPLRACEEEKDLNLSGTLRKISEDELWT